MIASGSWRCGRRCLLGMASLVILAWLASSALAQGPQVDVENPPGAPEGRGLLGPALGASGTSAFEATPVLTQESIVGGRAGPSVSRVPVTSLKTPQPAVPRISRV